MTQEEVQVLVSYFKLLAEIDNKHKRHTARRKLYTESINSEGTEQ